MSKSTGRTVFGSTNRGQTVTVIEAPIIQSQRRKAKATFWVTLAVTGLLAATVASHYMHPILGVFVGLATGFLLGVVFAGAVLIWPIVRIIWWWLPEILLGSGLIYGWTWLMLATPLWLSLGIVVTVGSAVGLVQVIRLAVVSVFWCIAVRHRLRVAFNGFLVRNRQGSLPLILAARPTPAGERVWVWLRPGLSVHDLEQPGQLQRLAVACWANEIRIARASRKYAALLQLDITRREPLTMQVKSPLPDTIPVDVPATAPVSPAPALGGLNLADVPTPRTREPRDTDRPRSGRRSAMPSPSDGGMDPSDYA